MCVNRKIQCPAKNHFCRMLLSLTIFLLLQVFCSYENPFSAKESEKASISIISTNHPNGSKITSSDSLIAKIRIQVAEIDTSGGKKYWLTINFKTGENSFSTDVFHGIYSIHRIVDTIDITYPFKSNFDKGTTSSLKYSLSVQNGTSLLASSLILVSTFLTFEKG